MHTDTGDELSLITLSEVFILPDLCFLFQDVDCAYMVKVDLEAKVGALADQIRFYRAIFEQVKTLSTFHLLVGSIMTLFLTVSQNPHFLLNQVIHDEQIFSLNRLEGRRQGMRGWK